MDQDPGDLTYTNKLLAYVDLSGWKTLVADPSALDRVHQAVRLLHFEDFLSSRTPYKDITGFHASLLSDSVVMTANVDRNGIEHMFYRVQQFSVSVLEKAGIVARGAMVVGPIYHQRSIIFGPALLAAYEIERTCAQWPRIIIDDSVVNFLSADHTLSPYSDQLVEDPDDRLRFVNIFGWALVEGHLSVLQWNRAARIRRMLTDKLDTMVDPIIKRRLELLLTRSIDPVLAIEPLEVWRGNKQ